MKNIKIEDIKLLYLVLFHRNLIEASNLLYITQPAVTARLNKLRDEFKDKLIFRVGNTMQLTEKGEELLIKIKLLYDHIEQIFPKKVIDPYHEVYEVNIYINEYYANQKAIINKLVNKFHSYNSKHVLNIQSVPLRMHSFLNKADDMEIDVIIGSIGIIDGFDNEIIDKHSLVLAYDDFPISKEIINLEYYKDLPHISIDYGKQDNFFLKYLGSQDPRNILIRTTNLSILKNLLSDKYVATLTKEIAEAHGLKFIDLPFATDPLDVHILYPTTHKHDSKSQWIRSIVKEVF